MSCKASGSAIRALVCPVSSHKGSTWNFSYKAMRVSALGKDFPFSSLLNAGCEIFNNSANLFVDNPLFSRMLFIRLEIFIEKVLAT